MPMPDNRSKYQRSHLFLLRVWCDAHAENASGDPDERTAPHWHGRVQRTVSGEEYHFDGKAGLIAVLETMLDQDRPERRQPAKQPSSAADTLGDKSTGEVNG